MGEFEELRRELQRLRKRVEHLERENAQLRSENARLREALEEARRSGKRQAAPFSRGRKKERPDRPGRKAGSAYGSQARRAAPKHIDERVTVDCPLICPHCGGGVRLEGKSSQYQTDIPRIEPATTEFEIHYGRCMRCDRVVKGREARQISDATGAVGGVQIGPNTIAMTAHLNKTCGMSYERIAEVFAQMFGLQVNRSTLARSLLRLGRKASPTYRNLIEQVRGSPVVSPDETGWRIGGDKAWLWTVATPDTTVYQIEPGRGYAEAAKLLGEDFEGVLCLSDGWAHTAVLIVRRSRPVWPTCSAAAKSFAKLRRRRRALPGSRTSPPCSTRHSHCETAETQQRSQSAACASPKGRSKRRWIASSRSRTCMTRAFASPSTCSGIAMACSSFSIERTSTPRTIAPNRPFAPRSSTARPPAGTELLAAHAHNLFL